MLFRNVSQMRISTFRKYWISLISLLAMLISVIASASPMNEMMIEHHQPTLPCEMKDQTSNPHGNHGIMAPTSAPDCGSQANMDHNCCPATCFSSVALFSDTQTPPLHVAKLALISADPSPAVVYQPQSLFRPPIR
ncbi:hypothetical protein AL542_15350 [Grimontia hollisae]|uniref:hypothetical protein n=2 Tax=Grimontia hollisae TaxID=673 RepID=UPI000590727D|nr:hypothetical protein [Grimontia hollisae]AMG31573.1 hypothetical protein AL542_15350 [Grimontia hollisae]